MFTDARPATWNFDLPLFRAAEGDADRLEALMAATVMPAHFVVVAEQAQRPVAFLWAERRSGEFFVHRLYVADRVAEALRRDEPSASVPVDAQAAVTALMARADEDSLRPTEWRMPRHACRGVAGSALAANGWKLDAQEGCWRRSVTIA